MKLKTLIASLLGVVAINGAFAGSYCPPPAQCDKCPIDCCDDLPGHIGVSYMSDYFFRGVRYSRDAVALSASYTIENCCVPITVGVNHVTALNSNTQNQLLAGAAGGGDQTDVFAVVAFPGLFGFDMALRYDHFFYPNWRQPSGSAGPGYGDSHGQLGLTIQRELFCGVNLSWTRAYDFNSPSAQIHHLAPVSARNNTDTGAWIHTVGLDKSFCVSDCISLDLSGGVLYNDNVWHNGSGRQSASGWNSYYLEAALPINVGNCATLTPYIGYNGTPDSWLADGVDAIAGDGNNANDAFHGGVRLGVSF